MKSRTCWALIMVTVLLMGAAWADTLTDYDHRRKFPTYRTYSWGRLETDDYICEQRIKNAVDRQLTAKGWKQVPSDGDVVVSVIGITHPDQTVHVTGSGWGGLLRSADDWNQFGVAKASKITYDIGTLVVEMFDSNSNNLLWRGISDDTFSEDPDKNTKRIDKNVAKMFKHFPPGSTSK